MFVLLCFISLMSYDDFTVNICSSYSPGLFYQLWDNIHVKKQLWSKQLKTETYGQQHCVQPETIIQYQKIQQRAKNCVYISLGGLFAPNDSNLDKADWRWHYMTGGEQNLSTVLVMPCSVLILNVLLDKILKNKSSVINICHKFHRFFYICLRACYRGHSMCNRASFY